MRTTCGLFPLRIQGHAALSLLISASHAKPRCAHGLLISAAHEAELFEQAWNGIIKKSAGVIMQTTCGLFPLRMQGLAALGLLISASLMLAAMNAAPEAELFKQAWNGNIKNPQA